MRRAPRCRDVAAGRHDNGQSAGRWIQWPFSGSCSRLGLSNRRRCQIQVIERREHLSGKRSIPAQEVLSVGKSGSLRRRENVLEQPGGGGAHDEGRIRRQPNAEVIQCASACPPAADGDRPRSGKSSHRAKIIALVRRRTSMAAPTIPLLMRFSVIGSFGFNAQTQ